MAECLVCRRLVTAALTVLVASCGMGQSASIASRPLAPDIQEISNAIAARAHYPTSAIKLASSEVQLRTEIGNAKLAMAHEATWNNATAALVGVAERVLASHPEYPKLQATSIAIIHPSPAGTVNMEWHTEDAVEFIKDSNSGFPCTLPRLISELAANPFHELERRKDDDTACGA